MSRGARLSPEGPKSAAVPGQGSRACSPHLLAGTSYRHQKDPALTKTRNK